METYQRYFKAKSIIFNFACRWSIWDETMQNYGYIHKNNQKIHVTIYQLAVLELPK